MVSHDIAGVILAGGAARRLNGASKPNIMVEGQTIISRIMAVFNMLFEEIILVTNTPDHYSEVDGKVTIVKDILLNRGPLGGIHAALNATTMESVFVVAGDMPFLDEGLIKNQIESYFMQNYSCHIPVVGENIEPLHGIYNKRLLWHLGNYLISGNNYTIRDFLRTTVTYYYVLDENELTKKVFTNINTPADLDKAIKLHL